MTQDDKVAESMFDEIIETRVQPDGEVEVELVSPSAEEEMREAAEAFVRCERRYREYNERPGAATDPGRRGVLWWREAEWLMLADNRLKEAFLRQGSESRVDPALPRVQALADFWQAAPGGRIGQSAAAASLRV